jgi:hypothetical protein
MFINKFMGIQAPGFRGSEDSSRGKGREDKGQANQLPRTIHFALFAKWMGNR